MKTKKTKKKGTTLLEVLIAAAIFSILVIALFAIIKYCMTNWRNVESRVAVQTEIRKVQTNLIDELRKTSFDSVLIDESDYRHTLAFKTFIDPDSGRFETDSSTGEPESQGYILYILLRPGDDPCSDTTSSDLCPHKMILRVDLTRQNDFDEGGTSTWSALSLDSSTLSNYIPATTTDNKYFSSTGVTVQQYRNSLPAVAEEKYVKNVYIIGKNILAFDLQKNESPTPEVIVTIKAVKLLAAGEFVKVGTDDLSDSGFTIQVTNQVIPQNP